MIATTRTDSSGNYALTDNPPDYYSLTASKPRYRPDSVNATADNTTTANILLCLIYDFNCNGGPADAGDLAMMGNASMSVEELA